MELLGIDDSVEVENQTLPNLEIFSNSSIQSKLGRVVSPMLGSLILFVTTTAPVYYTAPLIPVFDQSIASDVTIGLATQARPRTLSVWDKAWAQAGTVGTTAVERRQKHREMEAQEFLSSIEDE